MIGNLSTSEICRERAGFTLGQRYTQAGDVMTPDTGNEGLKDI